MQNYEEFHDEHHQARQMHRERSEIEQRSHRSMMWGAANLVFGFVFGVVFGVIYSFVLGLLP